MSYIKLELLKPLKISVPSFDDPKVTAWAKELISNINQVLIKTLENNRQREETGVNRINRQTFDLMTLGG